jgi:two-component system, chemotaxis family, sensor kinase CheA
MDMRDTDFFKELLSMFKMEAAEHIQSIFSGLQELETTGTDVRYKEITETLHRAAHSLKGAARTIGLSDVEPICQTLESFFGVMKRQKVQLTPDLKELIRRAVSGLQTLLASVNDEGKTVADKSELSRMIDEINSRISELNKQS